MCSWHVLLFLRSGNDHPLRAGPLPTRGNAWTLLCAAGMSLNVLRPFLPVWLGNKKQCLDTVLRSWHVDFLHFLPSFGWVCVWHVWRDVKLLFIVHGSAAWLWNRTQRSYHNHGISKLITSTSLPSRWNLHGDQQTFGCPLGFLLFQAVASYWWKHVVASWHLMCLVLFKCVIHSSRPTRCCGAGSAPSNCLSKQMANSMT